MKYLLLIFLFLIPIISFSQEVDKDPLWYIRLTPLQTKGNKTKSWKQHYIFQFSHDFVWVIDKWYNISYTMEMTEVIKCEDHIELTAKRNDNSDEIFFYIPLKEAGEFKILEKRNAFSFFTYKVEIFTNDDIKK